ncbi:MAG: TIM barrel protein [Acidimicrobiia bacterium]|nr:TIM barrel protein [Acidimicrobiia bacterium]
MPPDPELNPALGPGGFKLGTVTYNLAKDWDIPTLIRNCVEAGFEAVELRTTHRHGVEPSLSRERRHEVSQAFLDSPVHLLSVGTTCEYHSPDAAVVRKNIEETKRFAELAHDIGATGVKVRPNGIPSEMPEEKVIEQIGRSLRDCGQQSQGYGIEIWLEVHGRGSNIPARVRRMMEVADHPMVGLCWNSNPEDVEDGSVAKSFDLLKPWLRSVHINELWKREYPWRQLFSLLSRAEFNRYTLAEIEANADPVRLMRYYRALWQELCGQGRTSA